MSGLDARFITGPDLNQYFVNKDNGEALAGGKLYFYRDANRTEAKAVYQLVQGTGNPPQYSYVPFPNPIVLSDVGTIIDANGHSQALYYFPFDGTPEDSNGEPDWYYVACYDQFGIYQYTAYGISQGNLQFTREAWPFPNGEASNVEVNSVGIVSNQITNPTFTQVLFIAPTLKLDWATAGSETVSIAPGWDLVVTYSGAGSLTITQTPVIGSDNLINNPPFTLDFTMGANITSLVLQQTLYHNPDWAASNNIFPANTGWLSGSILIGPATTVTMQYVASAGNVAPQIILSQTNTDSTYSQVNNTIQLQVANSSQGGNVGYDTIQIVLPNTGTASISNVQVVSLNENVSNVAFEQSTSNKNLSLMFNYYKPRLDYKPIPSWLVGWDFALNPTQLLGPNVPIQGFGDNTSFYAWDQTIIYQSANNGVTVSRAPSGAMRTTIASVGNSQYAVIQYLPAAVAIEMLTRRKCVNVSANSSLSTVATVSLWYTKVALPSTVGSHQSIVSRLDSQGYPNSLNGTWIQIPRSGLANSTVTTSATNSAEITIPVAPAMPNTFNEIPLTGWDMQGNADIYNATYFAIVVGVGSNPQNAYIDWQSVSCQDGDIPTIPAPQTPSQVTLDCSYYFASSFNYGVAPANQTGINNGVVVCFIFYNGLPDPGIGRLSVTFPVKMNAVPTTITTYNPVNNNNVPYILPSGGDTTGANVYYPNESGFFFETAWFGGYNALAGLNWTADARLGQ